MARAMRVITVVTVLCCAVVALATEADSLRGALEALDRRQRTLQQRPAYQGARYHYPAQQIEQQDEEDVEFLPLEPGQPEDIGYGYQRGRGQKHETHPTPAQLERLLLEYLQGDEGEDSRAIDEDEKWSPFRERDSDPSAEVKRTPPASMFRERQRQDKRASPGPGDERYMQLLAALWDKYQRELEEQQEAEEESMEKRQDGGYGYGYDFYNSPMGWGDGHFNGYKRSGAAENDPWFPAFELVPRERQSTAKRFPVSKRSSGGAPLKKIAGDKVAKDLAEIFEDKKKSNTSNNTSTEAPTTVTTGTPHPVMHKKSVDWSQYFGIDRRRKKSSTPTESAPGEESAEEIAQRENEQRIMEQYYRTLALATTVKRKRSGDSESPAQTALNEEPASLEGMDQKLKAMEDLIVDEAVKYTGSHQGTADPQEIKSVKEQVLSRLSAAYSLEKMRQALDEFRSSLGPEEHEQGRGEKRSSQGPECPELRALAASCHRVQPAFVEPCTWHHACQICTGDGEGECDEGFLQAASQVCEGHVTCLRGARRLLTVLSRSETGPARCEICLRRFLELRRR